MRLNNKLLIGSLIVIVVLLLGGIGACMAEPSQYSFIANDFAQHTSFLASNGEWHAAAIAAIANIKIYLTTKEVATRYGIDPRSVQRRVKEQLLPKPYYFGTRFPRWSIEELDENDRRLAYSRHPNIGAVATKANAEAAKPKPPARAEKPRPPGGPRKHAAASPEDHEKSNPA
jgi:hypothetical protein